MPTCCVNEIYIDCYVAWELQTCRVRTMNFFTLRKNCWFIYKWFMNISVFYCFITLLLDITVHTVCNTYLYSFASTA